LIGLKQSYSFDFTKVLIKLQIGKCKVRMSQLVMKQVRMRDLFFSEHDGSGTEVVLDQFADQADQIPDSESPSESILVSVHQEQHLDEYNYYISSRVPVHTDPESELGLNVSASLQGVNYDLEYHNIPVAKRFCSLDESTGYQPFVHWSVPKEMGLKDSGPVDLQHQEPIL